jgi:hypothetical protein
VCAAELTAVSPRLVLAYFAETPERDTSALCDFSLITGTSRRMTAARSELP